MSIPLDRLYHYLASLISDDIIIYRWAPHGSKKLDDLQLLAPTTQHLGMSGLLRQHMIFHDQEPLNYNYYTPEICLAQAVQIASVVRQDFPNVAWCQSDKFINILASGHLRTATKTIINLNDNILICHSEQNSEQLAIYEQNGYVGVYYWSHALIARDWYRYALHDLELVPDFNQITHDFLIYGRAWTGTREYRLTVLDLLISNNLLENCNTRFNPVDNNCHYTEHKFVNDSLRITRNDIDQLIPSNTSPSSASADYSNSDYSLSGIEVVLETLFDDSRHHLTEKALRPIACGRPFILAGTPGSLSYLRSYGFKTFSGLIDESYDTVSDPLLRLQTIVKEMVRISNLSTEHKLELWRQLYSIAEYNKNRFFSQQFHNDIVDEFVRNIDSGLKKCQQTMNGKWWRMTRDPEIVGQVPPDTELSIQIEAWLANHNADGETDPSQSGDGS